MSASNRTPNVNLNQFVDTDKPTWLGDYNDDMTTIDMKFKSMQDTIDTLTLAQTTQASLITALTNRVNAANTQLRTLGQPGI